MKQMSKEVIILKGLPGSGKSTWANELIDREPFKWKRINKDSLREMMDAGKYSKGNEKFVLLLRDNLITMALGDGKSVIVDDTNFQPIHEERIREIVALYNKHNNKSVSVKIKFFDVSLDVCIERDNKRCGGVGEAVIRKQYDQFVSPKLYQEPRYAVQNESLPHAIIVDLDGTLALLNNRDPYNASVCNETDTINEPVKFLMDIIGYVEILNGVYVEILIISGRHGIYEKETRQWLEDNDVNYDELFMRKPNDHRDDPVIKKEIYNEHIKGKYNIKFVLDDRDRVVDFWRKELKLPCFQVWYGDF